MVIYFKGIKNCDVVLKYFPSPLLSKCYLLGALFSIGKSTIRNLRRSEEIIDLVNAINGFGARVEFLDDRVLVSGGIPKQKTFWICSSLVDLLLPVIALTGGVLMLKEKKAFDKLELLGLFRSKGMIVKYDMDTNSLSISGNLTHGRYYIDFPVSSEFLFSLILALTQVDEDSILCVMNEIETELVLYVLDKIGARFDYYRNSKRFFIEGSQKLKPFDVIVENDFFYAAHLMLVGALKGRCEIDIRCCRFAKEEEMFLKTLAEMGFVVYRDKTKIAVQKQNIKGICKFEVDVSSNPKYALLLTSLSVLLTGRKASLVGLDELAEISPRIYSLTMCLINELIKQGVIAEKNGNAIRFYMKPKKLIAERNVFSEELLMALCTIGICSSGIEIDCNGFSSFASFFYSDLGRC